MGDSVHVQSELSIYLRNRQKKETERVDFLYDREGRRKYLIVNERAAFLTAAKTEPPTIETFCLVLAYTGARLSEVLALTADRIDTALNIIVIETLKTHRKEKVYRAVPVPPALIRRLVCVHRLASRNPSKRLWPWCRTTGWKRVKAVMAKAGIEGPQATPKGLRHAFGVIGVQSGVPLTLVSIWLGHTQLETTAIYTRAVGEEEKSLAKRFWNSF